MSKLSLKEFLKEDINTTDYSKYERAIRSIYDNQFNCSIVKKGNKVIVDISGKKNPKNTTKYPGRPSYYDDGQGPRGAQFYIDLNAPKLTLKVYEKGNNMITEFRPITGKTVEEILTDFIYEIND